MGTRCTCGRGHETFAACMRAKNIRVAYCRSAKNWDYTQAKKTQRELDAYKAARDQGVQPAGTRLAATEFAMESSDRTGKAFNAENLTSNYL